MQLHTNSENHINWQKCDAPNWPHSRARQIVTILTEQQQPLSFIFVAYFQSNGKQRWMFNKCNCTIAVANGTVAVMTESQVTSNSKDTIYYWQNYTKLYFLFFAGENRSKFSEGPAQDGRRPQISGACSGNYDFLKMLRLLIVFF